MHVSVWQLFSFPGRTWKYSSIWNIETSSILGAVYKQGQNIYGSIYFSHFKTSSFIVF